MKADVPWRLLLIAALCCGPAGLPVSNGVAAASELAGLVVTPAAIELDGPDALAGLLVDGILAGGQVTDLTREARYKSSNEGCATVDRDGIVRAAGDGWATITVEARGAVADVPVKVTGTQAPRPLHFENDILPILCRHGCNSSGCHGKAEGQNGFKLSVFGFDSAADLAAITQEGRGRRVSAASPAQSLLLAKASGAVPHGGGTRLARHSRDYRLLTEWVRAGCPPGARDAPVVRFLEVVPRERPLSRGARQQLRVLATYDGGSRVDVTAHCRFQTNNEALLSVTDSGLVSASGIPGEAAVMAAYMGDVGLFRATVPREGAPAPPAAAEPVSEHVIDRLVEARLRKLNVWPSETCGDADFLRRAYLDVIGTLPTAQEAREFINDSRAQKRAALIERLLARDEFASFWALKWADLLRVDRQALGHKRAYAYYRWIRESIAENKPLDQFCRELVAAEGPLHEAPAGAFFKVVAEPGAMASTVAQVFLGVRIECARCHHHPYDRWGQEDFLGMQAHFTQVAFKPCLGGEALVTGTGSPAAHPRSGQVIHAHPLGAAVPPHEPPGNRRRLLAEWIASPENPWFARNLVNRAWAHFMGRGLVEPVDDWRSTNPPTNPELLDALARALVDARFDFKHLVRFITSSRAYQRSSTPNPTNQEDEQAAARALLKRLDAEVLLDAVCQATGVGEKFQGFPAGHRAIELWDSQATHEFLKLFGRPTRATACACERAHEPSVAQVLHVLNSPALQDKLSHDAGTLARLDARHAGNAELIDELYLTFYSRFPDAQEWQRAMDYLQAGSAPRRRALEDLAWSLLNTAEFIFNH